MDHHVNVVSLIFGVLALALFVTEAVRTRSLVPWGLASLTAMAMAHLLIETPARDLIHL